MRPELQIAMGSVMLFACGIWHIYALSELIVRLTTWYGSRASRPKGGFVISILIFLGILIAHTIQLYFWAGVLWLIGAISTFSEAIYFSLVTYTTLGYGDVVLADQFRILGAMESITGVLMFGITTAFLVGYFEVLVRDRQ